MATIPGTARYLYDLTQDVTLLVQHLNSWLLNDSGLPPIMKVKTNRHKETDLN